MKVERTIETSAVVTPNCAIDSRSQTSSYKMLQKPDTKKNAKNQDTNLPSFKVTFSWKRFMLHDQQNLITSRPGPHNCGLAADCGTSLILVLRTSWSTHCVFTVHRSADRRRVERRCGRWQLCGVSFASVQRGSAGPGKCHQYSRSLDGACVQRRRVS